MFSATGICLRRFVLVGLIFGLAGCGGRTATPMRAGGAASPSNPLAGSAWQVEDIDRGGIIDRSMVTLQFDGADRISGSTGCNRYFGAAAIDGDRLEVSGMGSTRKACVPALMQQEQRFLAALQETRTFRFENDTWLVLADDAGRDRLRAIRMAPADAPAAVPPTGPLDRPSATASVFTCAEGPRVVFRFLGPETIQLEVAGTDYVLQRQRAASGARYAGDGAAFWNKGGEAMLTIDEEVYRCVRQP